MKPGKMKFEVKSKIQYLPSPQESSRKKQVLFVVRCCSKTAILVGIPYKSAIVRWYFLFSAQLILPAGNLLSVGRFQKHSHSTSSLPSYHLYILSLSTTHVIYSYLCSFDLICFHFNFFYCHFELTDLLASQKILSHFKIE